MIYLNRLGFITLVSAGVLLTAYAGYRLIRWIIERNKETDQVDGIFRKTNFELYGTWWEAVKAQPEMQDYKRTWTCLVKGTSPCIEKAQQLQAEYRSTEYYSNRSRLQPLPYTQYNEPVGSILYTPGTFGLWITGVALMAAYLSAKKNVQGLFVCASTEAFKNHLEKALADPKDQRISFIIGVTPSGFNKVNFPQHKVTVGFEKKQGQVSIVLFDAQEEAVLDASKLTGEVPKQYRCSEYAMHSIIASCKKAQTQPRLLYTTARRESQFGCSVFGLQDAIAFLQDPQFFERSRVAENKIHVDSQYQIEMIYHLPPEFMIGTQSWSMLETYRQVLGENNFSAQLIGRNKSLRGFVEKYTFTPDQKKQNHYITNKHFKYLTLVVTALKCIEQERIREIINTTLLY